MAASARVASPWTSENSGEPQIERFTHPQAAAIKQAGDQAGRITRPVPDGLEQGLGFGRIFGGHGFLLTADHIAQTSDSEGQVNTGADFGREGWT